MLLIINYFSGEMMNNKYLTSPASWKGSELKATDVWRTQLTDVHVAEILAAVRNTIELGITIPEINQDNFPLPTLGYEMTRIYDEVLHGRGFAVLHGMPVDEAKYTREEVIRAYIGVGAWMGNPVSQNHKGHIVGHVKDIGADPKNKQNRIYATSIRQPYHTDSVDVVSLLCLKPCKSGGIFSITSTYSIYNEMLRTRPDLVDVLEAPFTFDRKGEIPSGKEATYEMPIFMHHKGRMLTMHDRSFIDAALEREEVPPLTDMQVEALDYFDEIAARKDMYLDLQWAPGDMGYVNNHQTVHARTDYEDFPELERRRHNVRLWLSVNHGWELPPVFEERYGPIARGENRGGIVVPGMKLTCPLEAE
ncbi:TauD/TfdA family dioxygenase [Amphritea sp. 2_MG-2023]|uniref:TauD/TfdA family dioxygenase n=1 Tax=Amphritea TaxID=515417 RepID=UPI001C067517|nr:MULTISPECIES: TauD/TfdA family dioxygenase [Amphritea]MBU2966746.1 TauD/TfdA family dioxygenase [Amphritea atlantica]MDO6418989.1 TauD/TfdA family dioxygenase [Amphritea sp. 2_MG-2023]